jgi:hypothetical protein
MLPLATFWWVLTIEGKVRSVVAVHYGNLLAFQRPVLREPQRHNNDKETRV